MTSHVHQKPMTLLVTTQSVIDDQPQLSTLSSLINSGPPLKRLTFSLSVNVIECKHLNGTGLNPICYIQLGPIKKRTQKIVGTNEPAFNQVINEMHQIM